MNRIKPATAAASNCARVLKVAPVTRAIRSALAASVTAFALAGGGVALAGQAPAVCAPAQACAPGVAGTLNFPVRDLTRVAPQAARSVAMPTAGVEDLDLGQPGDDIFSNDEDITVGLASGSQVAIERVSSVGDVGIINSGLIDVTTGSSYGATIGILGQATGYDVGIDNTAAINVDATQGVARGISASADLVSIDNGGDIDASGLWATTGIYGWGDESAEIVNTGAISASAVGGASGIYAGSSGSASVTNTGSISAYASSGGAYGISGNVYFGDLAIDNAGDVSATGTYATAIRGKSYEGDIAIVNSGALDVDAGEGGVGIDAQGGAVRVDNSGAITIFAEEYGHGMQVRSQGDVEIVNDGAITVDIVYGGEKYGPGLGSASGITVWSEGEGSNVSLTNHGDMRIGSLSGASGIMVRASSDDLDGTTQVTSTGTLRVFGGSGVGTGIMASDNGDVAIDNSGDLYVEGVLAMGVAAYSNAGDVVVTNAGDISTTGLFFATGIMAAAYAGDASIVNTGAITVEDSGKYGPPVVSVVSTDADAAAVYGPITTGIMGRATGNLTIDNDGAVTVRSGRNAIGISGTADGRVSIDNAGAIQVEGDNGIADGIFATGAEVMVTNAGDIAATGYDWAVGIEAQGDELVTLTNSGALTIEATGYLGQAFGLYATGGTGGVSVTNSGALAVRGDYATGIEASSQGALAITNAGDLAIGGTFDNGYGSYFTDYVATGIRATANYEGGAITIANSGVIGASALYAATGIEAVATGTGGTVGISNSGAITVDAAGKYATVTGIVASGDGDAGVTNTGTITALNGGTAYGAVALSFAGDANVVNAGDIEVVTGEKYSSAYGIVAAAQNGVASASNSGNLVVAGDDYAFGAQVNGLTGASFANTGAISVEGRYAYGVQATVGQGDASVVNGTGGSIQAYGDIAVGVFGMASIGDVTVSNAGLVEAVGAGSYGVFARSNEGDATVTNSGELLAAGVYAGNGVRVIADAGDAGVANTGLVEAFSLYGDAVGLAGYAAGAVSLSNGGTIAAESYYEEAFGLLGDGDSVSIGNSGAITASSVYYFATGMRGFADGELIASNSGDIAATGAVLGYGANVEGDQVRMTNAGDIAATAGFFATGIGAGAITNLSLLNTGRITAEAQSSNGISAFSEGTLAVENRGDVTALGDDFGIGVNLFAYGNATLINSGRISAEAAGDAIGVVAGSDGALTVDNRGTISATHDSYAVAVELTTAGTLINSGTLRTFAADAGQIAVRGSDDGQEIRNTGTIHGALVTAGGDDRFTNNSRGVWNVSNDTTDFGTGDDAITNAAGGTIHFADGSLHLGGSGAAGNAFSNAGTVRVSGTGLIHMGSGATTAPANARALVNTGVFDFVDGATDDVLTIIGDLAGSGALQLDMNPLDTTSDLLVVDGSIASGAVQTVNVRFDGMPSLDLAPIRFARVTGNSSAGSFVAGQVIGYDPRNFLDLQVEVGSTLSASNATADVFHVGIGVAGLNDTGELAATVASGAHTLIGSQVGSWRQRMGIDPARGERVGLGPWIRAFSDKGDVTATHLAGNVGAGGDLRYDQSSSGHELGFDAHIGGGFHAGVLLGKSDAKQRLVDGVGSDRIDASTSGLYATWFADRGFYVDASYRWMEFDARLATAGGLQETRGDGHAFNVEAGFTAFTFGAVKLTPQLQYTQATVGNIDVISGPDADFATEGGDSSRGRVGVEFSADLQAGNVRWVPYGAVSAVREFDGEQRYAINGEFFGATSTEGTSAMVDLGVGAQFGGVTVAGGVQWTDGGALENFFGGQLVLRYTW